MVPLGSAGRGEHGKLHRELLSALLAAGFEHPAASMRAFSHEKPMGCGALALLRLVRF